MAEDLRLLFLLRGVDRGLNHVLVLLEPRLGALDRVIVRRGDLLLVRERGDGLHDRLAQLRRPFRLDPRGLARAAFSNVRDGGVVEGGSIPYTPEGLKEKQENQANWLKRDPEIKCFMPGVPRIPASGPGGPIWWSPAARSLKPFSTSGLPLTSGSPIAVSARAFCAA